MFDQCFAKAQDRGDRGWLNHRVSCNSVGLANQKRAGVDVINIVHFQFFFELAGEVAGLCDQHCGFSDQKKSIYFMVVPKEPALQESHLHLPQL